jgi:hypothetical protein
MKHLRSLYIACALVACHGGSSSTASGPNVVALPNLGLKVTAPTAVNVIEERLPADMGKSYSLFATGGGVEMQVAISPHEPTVEEAKKSAKESNKASDIKIEPLSDGFALSYKFENRGEIMTQVEVYRTVAGKQTDCTFITTDPKQQAVYTDACKTLSPG